MAGLKLAFLLSMTTLGLVEPAHTNLEPDGPDFTAPAMAPQQFLMTSSPTLKKIVWTTLRNFESTEGRAFSLVDTGLVEPKGLAFDRKRGHLYVADSGAKKIFRYTVLADLTGSQPALSTSGVRLTITEGHPVEWVTIDNDGNLFYTAPDTNNINKISNDVMRRIAKGEFTASTLQIVSEKKFEAQQRASAVIELKRKRLLLKTGIKAFPTDAPPVKPHIFSIYEAALNPHVSSPASVWADGPDLYWTNQERGTTAGTIIKGEIDPKSVPSSKGPKPFPAVAMTYVSKGAYGLSKTPKMMFFTRNGSIPNTGLVSGMLIGTDIVLDFVKDIAEPRGLVWDNEETMYVADHGKGQVWSFPIGRMMANAPITKAVSMEGAYGLVLLSSRDACFAKNQVQTAGEMAKDDEQATESAEQKEMLNQQGQVQQEQDQSFLQLIKLPSWLSLKQTSITVHRRSCL